MSADVWFEPCVPDTEALSVVEPAEPDGVLDFADEVGEDAREQFMDAWQNWDGRLVVLPADLEYQHRAALVEIELPPRPFDVLPSWLPVWRPDWAAVGHWIGEAAQIALGVVLGFAAVSLLLAWLT